jgi:CcmD family protein
MDQPAQTTVYMIAGYVIIFGALTGYIISLAVRWKKLKAEKKYLENRE